MENQVEGTTEIEKTRRVLQQTLKFLSILLEESEENSYRVRLDKEVKGLIRDILRVAREEGL